MYTYLDYRYMIAEQCLLGYLGDEAAVVLPEKIDGGHVISEIGNGALANKNAIEAVAFPDTVISFGDEVFCGSNRIRYVELPLTVREMSHEAFKKTMFDRICVRMNSVSLDNIWSHTTLSNGTERLICPTDLGACRIAVNGMVYEDIFSDDGKGRNRTLNGGNTISDDFSNYELNDEINWLFKDDDPTNVIFDADKYENVSIYCRDGLNNISEIRAIKQVIDEKLDVYTDAESEDKSDWNKKVGKNGEIQKTVILLAKPSESVLDDSPVLDIKPEVGYFFFPSVRRVICDGEYWIYRRCYLVDSGYVPRDIAVFDRNGIVRLPEVKRKVYAKYKLLSCL